MSFLYFTSKYAIQIHDFIIAKSGGSYGVNNIGLLESVLDHIQNDFYYPEFEDKLTHLVYSVNKNHTFSDGNKRSSIALGAYFLEINGLDFCINRFVIEMENLAVHIADNRIEKELLADIIYSLVNEDDYSEEIRIRIIDAIS